MYAKLLAIPLVVSYHTHIPEYIPMYTWKGLVEPMWNIIRYCTLVADLALVPSQAMKVISQLLPFVFCVVLLHVEIVLSSFRDDQCIRSNRREQLV